MTTDLIKKLEALTVPVSLSEATELANSSPFKGDVPSWMLFLVALMGGIEDVGSAIALAERVLPTSVAKRLIVFNSSPAKAGFDGTPERGKLFYFEAHNPAIAACIAILKAKGAST